MAITLQGVGTMVGSAGSVVASPLTAINPTSRLLILFVTTARQEVTVTVNAGGTGTWTEYKRQNAQSAAATAGTASGFKVQVFWKYGSNTNAASDQALISDGGDHQIGVITAWDGAEVSPRPITYCGQGVKSTASTSWAVTGSLATTAANSAVIIVGTGATPGTSVNTATAFTNAGLTGITEMFDKAFSLNFGGSLFGAWGLKAVAGAPGTTTITVTPSQLGAAMSLFINPIGGGITPQSRFANFAGTMTFGGSALTSYIAAGGAVIARAKRFFDWL